MMFSKNNNNKNVTHNIYSMSMAVVALVVVCILVDSSSAQNSCRTPDNKSGSCISIYDCANILSLIKKTPLSNADKLFAQQSQCQNGVGRSPFVCCATGGGNAAGPGPSAGNGEGVILPSLPRCGQAAVGDRIYNGNDTLLDEFAWMVLLEYVGRDNKPILNCAGSLINQRYVLTAAHCVTGAILREVGRLNRIRLGEYDLSKDIDCLGKDCADPVINMGFEEVIPHPQYDDSSKNKANDIALIRLDGVVTYTDFIKPVCLPSAFGVQSQLRTGTNLIVAGWGRTLDSRQSKIKQKLYIPINDFQECSEKFAAKRIQLESSQLCVGGQWLQDSCDGDSGGPLMREANKLNYAIEGVVSFGNRCGLEEWPGIYTKVSDFEPWIKATLRP
ncbi:serine protease 7-like [Episyrphus balteatus]|uniref:serine protease 7-like n=1 Tax=Episyrphus balteatus TaxID=286459 RepID=UPI00248531DA|nr:serine protease 7-like [Episyrphus balteatus]